MFPPCHDLHGHCCQLSSAQQCDSKSIMVYEGGPWVYNPWPDKEIYLAKDKHQMHGMIQARPTIAATIRHATRRLVVCELIQSPRRDTLGFFKAARKLINAGE